MLGQKSLDAVESISWIPVSLAVQISLVLKNNLAFREGGGTKRSYVDPKAAGTEEYGVVVDTDSFQDVVFLIFFYGFL